MSGREPTESDSVKRASQLLERMTGRGGPGIDELLAAGDGDAATMRSALDAIIASVGNDSGLRFAMSKGDVTEPVSDMKALVPQLQERIERVIDRMKSEYGHDVNIVETARSQERQDYLYEQGRTRPGQVVTWTRNSAHTRGQAADVIVDGKWDNPEGFARLQRIAREEGLRTLGVSDPGHLELPRNGQGSSAASTQKLDAAALSARIERTGGASRSSSAARSGVAQVAGVASVAGVATVAQSGGARASLVSPHATDSNPSSLDVRNLVGGKAAAALISSTVISSGNATTIAGANPLANASVQSSLNASAGKSEHAAFGSKFGGGSNADTHDHRNERSSSDRDKSASINPIASVPINAAQVMDGGKAPAAIGAVDYAARVADVQDARDAVPGSVSRLTLSMDGPDGGEERITIGLRGKTVETHISTNSPAADQMRANAGELTDALGRQGLDGDTVRITGTPRNESASATNSATADRDGVRVAATQQGHTGDGPTGEGQRDRSSGSRDSEAHADARRAREEQERSQGRSKEQYREHSEKQNHNKDSR